MARFKPRTRTNRDPGNSASKGNLENAEMAEAKKELVIDEATAQALLNYLAQRPYIEVYRLIPAVIGLKPVPEFEVKEP